MQTSESYINERLDPLHQFFFLWLPTMPLIDMMASDLLFEERVDTWILS